MRDRDEAQELRYLDEDLSRRRPGVRVPRRLGEAVTSLLARTGWGQTQSRRSRQEAWALAVGEPLSRHTRAGDVRRGVLQVVARDSMTLQQLTFRQAELVRRMAELAPDEKITSVRFRVGAIAEEQRKP